VKRTIYKVALLSHSEPKRVAAVELVVVEVAVVVVKSYIWEVWMRTWLNQIFVITSLHLEMLALQFYVLNFDFISL